MYRQNWFDDPTSRTTCPALWDKYWGYLSSRRHRPGAARRVRRQVHRPASTTEGIWQRTLFSYLQGSTACSYTYWSWNPDSGDTGGILKDDWKTIDQAKLDLLKSYQSVPAAKKP